MIRARMLLQLAIEGRLLKSPSKFGSLERSNDRFREFAYETHAAAYLRAGIAQLGDLDLVKIGTTPDFFDLFSADGVRQVLAVAPAMAEARYGHIPRQAKRAARSVGGAAKDPRKLKLGPTW